MKSKKVILDTNLWISFLITRKLDFLDKLLGKNIHLIFSKELIEEFLEVAQRPKFEKYFSTDDVKYLLRLFREYGKWIEIKSAVNDCRDTKDNFLLNLAIDGKADFLITGDKDLLTLENINQTKIITLAEFTSLFS